MVIRNITSKHKRCSLYHEPGGVILLINARCGNICISNRCHSIHAFGCMALTVTQMRTVTISVSFVLSKYVSVIDVKFVVSDTIFLAEVKP